MLYKDPTNGKSEAVEIKVNFSMAYGETQNFSQPIYSGIFAFKCTFSKKNNKFRGQSPENNNVSAPFDDFSSKFVTVLRYRWKDRGMDRKKHRRNSRWNPCPIVVSSTKV